MSGENDGSPKKPNPQNDSRVSAEASTSAPVEPAEPSLPGPIKIKEQENPGISDDTGGEQPSISEQALVDRITRSDRWMIFLTAVIAVGGLLSAVIFGYQLHEMKVAAELTRESIAMSKAALAIGQRAIVFVKDSPWRFVTENGQIKTWVVSPLWENAGNTPTQNLSVKINCFSARPHVSQPENYIDESGTQGPRSLGPKQTILGGACEFTPAELAEVGKGEKKFVLYLTARATYQDVFGDDHQTDFCMEFFEFLGDLTKVMEDYKARNCASGNCTDDECPQYVEQ